MRSLPPLLALVAAAGIASAGHVSVPFRRTSHDREETCELVRRDKDLTLEAINNITGGGYYAEFEIGTPPQKLGFLLDTGSSDTWVNSVNTDLCNSLINQTRIGFCEKTFDPSDSSTFKIVDHGGFDITYLDGRNIQGDYFNDTVTINGMAIKNQKLGLADISVRPTGILGLGFSANVAARTPYPTVVDNMVAQGMISKAAFSLYLNDLETSSGNILFGAIDSEKYIGNLTTLPLVATQGVSSITSFAVHLTGFSASVPSGKTTPETGSVSAGAVLDSGSTICLLPANAIEPIWNEFGVVNVPSFQTPFVDCAWRGAKGDGYTLDFQFGNKTIAIPLHEVVVDAYNGLQDTLDSIKVLRDAIQDFEDGACLFGVGSTASFNVEAQDFALLGDTFLRSAYVVYDLANDQVGIAQANLNSTDTHIVDIDNSGALPDVKGVDAQTNSTDSGSSGGSSSGGSSSPSPSSTGSGGDGGDSGDDSGGAGHFSNPFTLGALGVPAAATFAVFVGAALVAL